MLRRSIHQSSSCSISNFLRCALRKFQKWTDYLIEPLKEWICLQQPYIFFLKALRDLLLLKFWNYSQISDLTAISFFPHEVRHLYAWSSGCPPLSPSNLCSRLEIQEGVSTYHNTPLPTLQQFAYLNCSLLVKWQTRPIFYSLECCFNFSQRHCIRILSCKDFYL